MSDIIDEIDAIVSDCVRPKYPDPDDLEELAELVVKHWPAIRDRLREAERRAKALDEELQSVLADWNAARAASGSRTNGGLVGHIGDLARRAKAFDAIASERIVIRHPFVDGRISEEWEAVPEWSSRDSRSPDLLTAIETALRREEQSK
jgi:hypothetical protein